MIAENISLNCSSEYFNKCCNRWRFGTCWNRPQKMLNELLFTNCSSLFTIYFSVVVFLCLVLFLFPQSLSLNALVSFFALKILRKMGLANARPYRLRISYTNVNSICWANDFVSRLCILAWCIDVYVHMHVCVRGISGRRESKIVCIAALVVCIEASSCSLPVCYPSLVVNASLHTYNSLFVLSSIDVDVEQQLKCEPREEWHKTRIQFI